MTTYKEAKVHWRDGEIWYWTVFTACGIGGLGRSTRNPDKVTCRHPACVKAAAEAKKEARDTA